MWKTVKLGDVATIIAGQSPTGENYNNEGQGMPFYQGKKDYGDKFLKPPTVWTKSVTKVAIEGDVLMSVRAPVGALNIATQEICIGRGLAAIRVHTEIDKDYLFYALAQISDGLTGSSGAIFNSINKKQIESIEFLLPPLAEQHRIVAKLDATFAEIDTAVEAADMSGKKLKEQQTLNTETVFNETCSPFKKIVLGDVCDGVQYGTSSKCSKIGKYPVLRMGNIQNGAFDVSDLVYLDDEIEAKKYELNKGDVLFNRTNSSVHVGKTSVFDEVDDYLFAGYLIRVNYLKDKVLPQFLSYYLNSRKIREYGFSVMSESINQSNINGTKLKKYPFYEVPLEAQKNATQKISAVNRASDEAINLYRKKIKVLIKLKSAILAQELQSEVV